MGHSLLYDISINFFFFYNDWISQSTLLFTQGLVVLADSATLISGLPHNCFFFSFFLGFATGNVACNHKGEWTGPGLRSLMVAPLSQEFQATKIPQAPPFFSFFFSISWLLMQAAPTNVALQARSDQEACGKPDRRAGRVASLLTATVRPAPLQRGGGGTVPAPCFRPLMCSPAVSESESSCRPCLDGALKNKEMFWSACLRPCRT